MHCSCQLLVCLSRTGFVSLSRLSVSLITTTITQPHPTPQMSSDSLLKTLSVSLFYALLYESYAKTFSCLIPPPQKIYEKLERFPFTSVDLYLKVGPRA